MALSDRTQDSLETEVEHDFVKQFDEDADIYPIDHYCDYTEICNIAKIAPKNYFSVFSHNIRSLQGHHSNLIYLLCMNLSGQK